jgi:hypothetical protein
VHGEPCEDWVEKKIFAVRRLVEGFRTYNGYGCFYFMCEYFNFFIIILNLVAMDNYLETSPFGLYAVGILKSSDTFPILDIIFPEKAKCDYHRFGPGGNIGKEVELTYINNPLLYATVFMTEKDSLYFNSKLGYLMQPATFCILQDVFHIYVVSNSSVQDIHRLVRVFCAEGLLFSFVGLDCLQS